MFPGGVRRLGSLLFFVPNRAVVDYIFSDNVSSAVHTNIRCDQWEYYDCLSVASIRTLSPRKRQAFDCA